MPQPNWTPTPEEEQAWQQEIAPFQPRGARGEGAEVYPNPPATQTDVQQTYYSAGLSPQLQSEVNKLPFDIKPFGKLSTGETILGSVSGPWGAGGRLIPGRIQVAEAGDIGTPVHEMAHVWWEDGYVDRQGFAKALDDLLNDPQLGQDYPETTSFIKWIVNAGPEYTRNRSDEIYAYVAGFVGGNLEKLPPVIRPYYEGMFTGDVRG